MNVSKKDFEAKIEYVRENIYCAHCHLKIHEYMTDELRKNLDSYPNFFNWSRMAHLETGVLRLTRAYDKNSLGLLKIVNIFEFNYKHWGLEKITDVTSLKQAISDDKIFLETDSRIQELIHWRDKAIAHTDNNLYPHKPSFNISEIHGGNLIFKENRLTTEEIENLPVNEREQLLMQKRSDLFQAITDDSNKVLGQKIPSFHQLYELTTKGVEICNRYMMNLGIDPIDLQLIDLQLEEIA